MEINVKFVIHSTNTVTDFRQLNGFAQKNNICTKANASIHMRLQFQPTPMEVNGPLATDCICPTGKVLYQG